MRKENNMKRTKQITLSALIFFSLCSTLLAQKNFKTSKNYLGVDGKPFFITGVNYSPSTGWFQMLDNWNANGSGEYIARGGLEFLKQQFV